jgi:type I restriction enzyme M protein
VTQARAWHEVEERLRHKWGDFDAIEQIARSSFQHESSFARTIRAVGRLPLPEDGSASAVVADVICQALTRLDVASGKLGDLVTPDSLVRCMVELADPRPGQSVHDPFCRSGEFLARTARKLDSAGVQRRRTALSGVSPNEHHWRLSSLIAMLGRLDVDLGDGLGDALIRSNEERRAFDIVVTNPPFNIRHTELPHGRWIYGDPPRHNANFAWLQQAASLLKDNGRAVVLMPNSAGVSEKVSEATIRKRMIQAGVVECVVALPPSLFRSTTIPVSIWILRGLASRSDKRVLLVDATGLGAMVDRAQRGAPAAFGFARSPRWTAVS